MAELLAKTSRVNATKSAMSGAEFRALVKAEGLNMRSFARLTGINERTAHAYGRDEQEIPVWVSLVLSAFRAASAIGLSVSVTEDKRVQFSVKRSV